MSKDEALAFLRGQLRALQDACCYHQDEFGAHYAPDCQDDLDGFEGVIDFVENQ